ncbi:MAG: right-handed parallel beta-helix repeat-containing protein, partial [Planctomycetales bacterium]|nr:right-handed parallel beta-helix repeat-containing protein [Planctomycetales bacterium]
MGIEFDIPTNDMGYQSATATFKITPASVLPTITKPVEIDATTQPGYSDKPIVEVTGASLPDGSNGVHVTAGETIVRGFTINGFQRGNAILLESSGKNLIERNFLGTDVLGEEAKANGVGLRIVGVSENIVQDNLISGNATIGVEIVGNDARDNQLFGNYIGTDVDGLQAIPNVKNGIVIRESSSNRIGGLLEGDGNVISGNGDNSSSTVGGILIQGTSAMLGDDARDNRIEGNLIGPNKDGTGKLTTSDGSTGNIFVGIALIDASHTIIGGTSPAARNIISGNLRGVHIRGTGNSGSDAHENVVQGNYIGTNKAGDQKLGNGDGGIRIEDSSRNVIGGIVSGTGPDVGSPPGNLISGNLTGIDILGLTIGGKNTAIENLVQGNLIGTNATGTAAIANFIGIDIRSASSNTIGGMVSGARNVISGNTEDGIVIRRTSSVSATEGTGNKIQGNYIGVGVQGNRPGGADLGNGANGVKIVDTRGNIIGGLTTVDGAGNPSPGTAPGNVISDNGQSGISIEGASADANVIQGNILGTDATASVDLGNDLHGIRVAQASGAMIGGTTASARNLVSGNDITGIWIVGPSSQNVIQGNYIGTQLDGRSPLANGFHGVFVLASNRNVIGGTTATEAGSCKGACNIIAFNGTGRVVPAQGHGVVIQSGTMNRIQRNSIFDNSGRGIDLGDDSFTLNDLRDDDGGANDLQDYPVATSVAFGGLLLKTITWTLNSSINTKYTLDFYSNLDPDPSGFGEGRYYLGSVDVTTNAQGNVSTTQIFPGTALYISATATDPNGNTSEFSMVDTDGDALADAWETQGTDVDGDGTVELWEMGTLDFNEDGTNDHVTPTFLPALGGTPAANPFHKDLFVEVDTMLGVGLAQPTQATLNVVANGQPGMNDGFANVPDSLVRNPDGRNGITLHAILSDTNIANQTFAAEGWPEFDAIKAVSFGNPAGGGVASERGGANSVNILAAKRLAYRYALFGDRRVGNTISGVGELPLDAERSSFGGNDFIINLGGWSTRGGTAQQQQGTFMHELGHTLGIGHGGGDHQLYKPNYYSVMNYMWQTPKWFLPNWTLDYSRVDFGELNEASLNEASGVITTTDATDRATANAIAAISSVQIGGRSTRDAVFAHGTPPGPLSAVTMRTAASRLILPMAGAVDFSRLNLGPFVGLVNRGNVLTLATTALPHDDDGPGGTSPLANTGLRIDINGDGAIRNLPGHEDWSSLRFYFLESEQGSRDGVHEVTEDEEDIFRQENVISMDYADAPAPYPTLLDVDGPRHLIPGPNTPILGQRVDLDADGQPDSQARGDDLADGNDLSSDATPADTDDEDGVIFNSPFVPGESASVTVMVTLPVGVMDEALLDAWFDFNADGDWLDVGEQVVVSRVVVQGENSLTINVPTNATKGTTFTRFRLSSQGGLSPTGLAADGEVEDYAVVIGDAVDIDIRSFTTDPSVSLQELTVGYEITNAN